VAGVVAGGAAGAAALGNRKWSRTTSRAVEGLVRRAQTRSASFAPTLLAGLPDPVARYFESALERGQPFVRSARVEHSGEFRTGGLEDPWTDFRSVQHFTAEPPGFVWDARIRMGPLLSVRVRDCYVGGRGSMIGSAGPTSCSSVRSEKSSSSRLRASISCSTSSWRACVFVPFFTCGWPLTRLSEAPGTAR